MSTVQTDRPADPGDAPTAGSARSPRTVGTWTLRLRGLKTVIGLELRQRIRSARWYVMLGVWAGLLLALSLFILLGSGLLSGEGVSLRATGTISFTADVYLVLFAMLLIIPALASGAINGDRTAGTLATLQSTLLSPAEIVVGKIIAGWLIGMAFLVAAIPAVVPSAILAQVSFFYLIRILLMTSAITLCITAVGVGISALTARQLGSVVLSYLVVLFVTAILPIVYLTSLPMLVAHDSPVVAHDVDEQGRCIVVKRKEDVIRSDIALPLLAVNPLVMVSEMATPLKDLNHGIEDRDHGQPIDGLRIVSFGMGALAQPYHPSLRNSCWKGIPGYVDLGSPQSAPTWPWSLGAYVVVAGLSGAVAIRRVRTPVRRLPKGQRIA